jgi:hypothetical protein
MIAVELEKYNLDISKNWVCKVNVINLLIGSYATQYTQKTGASNVKLSDEDFANFLQICVFSELEKPELVD